MSEQDYDVIINDKEYKQLKQNKNKVIALQKKILQSKQNDESKNLKIGKLQKQVQIQKEEIAFLNGLIQNIGNQKHQGYHQEIHELEHSQKSANYEVLGESIMFPKKVNPKQSQLKSSQLVKKYSATIEIVGKIEEKLQTQEILIKQLNQMNSQKSQLLLVKNTQKVLQMISEKLQVKINSLDHVKDVFTEHKLLKDQKTKLEKQNAMLEQQKKRLEQLVNNYSEKLRKSEQEIVQIKKQIKDLHGVASSNNNSSSSSYGDRPYRIKLLIDQHIKEMQKSLGSVGGLSSEEIHSMLNSELKSLIEYIPKSMEKKK